MSERCVRFVEGKFFLNDSGLTVTSTSPEVSQGYIDLLLHAKAPEIYALGGGTAQKNLDTKSFRSLQIPLPPLVEQKQIVALLDEAFAGIDEAKTKAKEILTNLDTIIGASFDHAISGKLTQGWRASRTDAGNAGSDLKQRLAYRRKFQEGTGKYREPDEAIPHSQFNLPNGWTLASPEQVTTHIVDCPHSTPKWTESGILCLRTSNFRAGRLDLQSPRYVSQQTYKERIARLEPKPGDVLYSREGSILGIACLIPESQIACLGQRMMLLRADTSLILPEYLTAVLNSSLILKEVKRLTSGAGSPHLNICDIRTFPIPLPTLNEQRQIIAKLGIILGESAQLTKAHTMMLSNLDDLRSALLSQAFAGQLTD
jgi:type I restriction enzyme S subunit